MQLEMGYLLDQDHIIGAALLKHYTVLQRILTIYCGSSFIRILWDGHQLTATTLSHLYILLYCAVY